MDRGNPQILMGLGASLIVLLLSADRVGAHGLTAGCDLNPINLASARGCANVRGTAAGDLVLVNDHGGEVKGDRRAVLACGPNLVCDPTRQYCSVFSGGPAGVPRNYACKDLPKGCPSPPTCECIRGSSIGCECTALAGAITVTCTAP